MKTQCWFGCHLQINKINWDALYDLLLFCHFF